MENPVIGTIKPLLVLGATGVVGRGVVQAAVAAARPVIAVARDPAALERLGDEYPHAGLVVLAHRVGNEADGVELARRVRALGRPLAGVVAALAGNARRGRILDQPAAELARTLDEDLMPHLAAARALLPLLADGGRGGGYVMVGGPGSEYSWAGYGHRSVTAAALRMLACVLHEEARPLAVRVQLLSVDTPVRSQDMDPAACPQWPGALAIGQCALEMVGPGAGVAPTGAVVRYAPCVPGPSAAAQDPDSHTPLAARCLHDARSLLRALTPVSYRNEASRHGSK